jgi:phage tail-like protein
MRNLAFALATQALGVRLDPYMAYNFLVEIDGLLTGGFREVRGIESSVKVEEYAEGGNNGYVHKIPGVAQYQNLVLSHGLTDIDALWSWYDRVTRGVIRRKNMTIMVLDRQRLPVMWWDVRDALPVKWTGPAFNASQESEVAVESVELIHNGIVKPFASQALSMARGVGKLATG